jgi:hypothetical protein
VKALLATAAIVLVALTTACGTATTPGTPTAEPAAATRTTESAHSRVAAWRDNGGLELLQNLATDMDQISDAGSRVDSVAMLSACTSLREDVEAAQAYPALPQSVAQTSWAAALAQLARSATDCIAGVESTDPSTLSRAATELRTATTYLDQVTIALKGS